MTSKTPRLAVSTCLLVGLALTIHAQQPQRQQTEVGITLNGQNGQPPVLAIQDFAAFATDAESQEAGRLITSVLHEDLDFERQFIVVSAAAAARVPAARDADTLPYDRWIELRADAVAVGTVEKTPAGLTVTVRVIGVKGRQTLFAETLEKSKNARLIAHRFSDDIHKQLRHLDGVAQTYLAFVSDRDGDRASQVFTQRQVQEVYLSDYDGANSRRVTAIRGLTLGPAWSPDGRFLAYVTYASGFPDIAVQAIYEAAFPTHPVHGTDVRQSYMPAWSPDGTKLAFNSSMNGVYMHVYVINRDGTNLHKITNDNSVNEAPAWSPGGNQIVFISDRGGSPQVYVTNADGTGGATRLSRVGGKCDRPTWSPDGNYIAYTGGTDSAGYDILLYNLATQETLNLTGGGGGSNESPTFAPNSLHVAFTTTRWGKEQIATVGIDGKFVRRVTAGTTAGANKFPSWSPNRH